MRSELKKRKEIEGLKIGKPTGKDRNGITISFKKETVYKGYIKTFRPENKKKPYIEVRYTWSTKVDSEKEFKTLKQRMSYLIERPNESLNVNEMEYESVTVRDFQFYREGWKTEEEDRQWIMDRIIDLLKALENSE